MLQLVSFRASLSVHERQSLALLDLAAVRYRPTPHILHAALALSFWYHAAGQSLHALVLLGPLLMG